MDIIVLTRLNDNMRMPEIVPITYAFMLKKKYGATITVISLSSKCSQKTLDYLNDYGVSNVIFVSDDKFKGSDTYATALVLAESIKKSNVNYDLILTSDMSSFGETGFVPIMVANILMLNYEVGVDKIKEVSTGRLIEIERKLSSGSMVEGVKMPCLIAVEAYRTESFFNENSPNLFDIMQFDSRISIKEMGVNSLNISCDKVGLVGSTTKVISSSGLNTLVDTNIREEISNINDAVELFYKCLE